ncbi:MAG: hypothetical protein M1838_004053 [Thelocarpon superellum]|nr:MAG: hypothetical protein M1838_004053 [Thelocarpon superellum]
MAKRSSLQKSSNPHQSRYAVQTAQPVILADCYVVKAGTAAVQAFHYSSTGAGGEGTTARKGSLGMGADSKMEVHLTYAASNAYTRREHGVVEQWAEVWDYSGDAHFRGFVAPGTLGRGLFIFFDHTTVAHDLKHGYAREIGRRARLDADEDFYRLMALIELASTPSLACERLVICLERSMPAEQLKDLVRVLGWVGLELTTLAAWTSGTEVLSDQWMFLGMEV